MTVSYDTTAHRMDSTRIVLPFPPEDAPHLRQEMDIYVRFMRQLRSVPCSQDEIKILVAIQSVADMLAISDAFVARVLVDLGLRAPRLSFPESYLEHVDASLMRSTYHVCAASPALLELKQHWNSIGEDRLAAFRRVYPSLTEGLFTPAS